MVLIARFVFVVVLGLTNQRNKNKTADVQCVVRNMSVIHYVRLAIASFYCLAGIAAFVTFLIIVNYAAAVWSLLTGK